MNINKIHTSQNAAPLPLFLFQVQYSPCNSPIRNLATVMRARVWDPSWARRGVQAVIRAHKIVEMNRMHSPPTLLQQTVTDFNPHCIKVGTHHALTSVKWCYIILPADLLTCHWHVLQGSVWNSNPRRIHPGPSQNRSCSSEKWQPLTRHRLA